MFSNCQRSYVRSSGRSPTRQTHITTTLLVSSRLLGLRACLVGIERCLLDGGRGVVGAGFAVLVGLGLERVFVLSVFAGEARGCL